MSLIQTLKIVSVARPSNLSPLIGRRHKLIDRIHQQILAAEAWKQGQHAMRSIRRKVKNKDTGQTVELQSESRIRELFWLDQEGRVFLELKYGARTLEFAKGKTAIEVGALDNLVPTLEKLKQAVHLGELDEQLASTAGRLQQQLDARKTAKK